MKLTVSFNNGVVGSVFDDRRLNDILQQVWKGLCDSNRGWMTYCTGNKDYIVKTMV